MTPPLQTDLLTHDGLDVLVEDHGTIVMLQPLSSEGRDWLSENCQIEAWQRWGTAVALDHRMAANLIDQMEADGLDVA